MPPHTLRLTMVSTRTRGACVFCGADYTRAGMAKHLQACKARAGATAAAAGAGTQLHLQVQDAYGGAFWLQLEMDGAAPLQALDRYLRAIWLECCGHMSAFSYGGWGDDLGMTRKASSVLKPGTELVHRYDFGTTSETLVRAIAARPGKPLGRHPITLMARNRPPVEPCAECKAPATHLCMECVIEEDEPGLLCEAHTAAHPHGDNYGPPTPLYNSPRMGMCGYEGPAEPPY